MTIQSPFDKSKLKLVVEARPDKNIFYYFTDNQYEIFERTMNNWDRRSMGKFSISKCLDYLNDLGEYYEINDPNWSFENIIKEEKPLDLNNKIKGMNLNYIYYEDLGVYDKKE